MQNLIIFACFQPILVLFPLICGWNIIIDKDILENINIDIDTEILENIDIN